jgi:hypothetical protein
MSSAETASAFHCFLWCHKSLCPGDAAIENHGTLEEFPKEMTKRMGVQKLEARAGIEPANDSLLSRNVGLNLLCFVDVLAAFARV